MVFPISTDKWTHINTSLYHTYRRKSLFLSHICYLYSVDQTHNSDKIRTSLLTDLTSHKGPAIGGPTTSDVHLQQAPFCFSRQNSINNSYPQLGTMPPHLYNHTSLLSFPSGLSVYHVSGTAGHSLTFSWRLPSAYVINTPLVGATLASSLSVSETTGSQKDPYLLLISAVVFLPLEYFSYMEPLLVYVFPLAAQEHVSWYIWPQIFLLLLTVRPVLPTNS